MAERLMENLVACGVVAIALMSALSTAEATTHRSGSTGAGQQNWLKDEAKEKAPQDYYERVLKDRELFRRHFYKYDAEGPRGMPRFTVEAPVDRAASARIRAKLGQAAEFK